LAIQTGLRAGELSELIRANLKLSAKHPYVLCKASTTKDGKSARQFIDPVLAIDLRSQINRKHPAAKVFNIGSKDELSRSLERDLIDSRRLWLESLSDQEQAEAGDSDFLCKTNHGNEHLVFHSLRHTCGSWLAQSGASIKVVQTVMRNSTAGVTIRRYGHLFPGECEAAPIQIAAMMTGQPDAKMGRANKTRKHA
jgi:integrase